MTKTILAIMLISMPMSCAYTVKLPLINNEDSLKKDSSISPKSTQEHLLPKKIQEMVKRNQWNVKYNEKMLTIWPKLLSKMLKNQCGPKLLKKYLKLLNYSLYVFNLDQEYMSLISRGEYIESMEVIQDILQSHLRALIKDSEILIEIQKQSTHKLSITRKLSIDKRLQKNVITMDKIILDLKYIHYILLKDSAKLREKYEQFMKSSNISGLIEIQKQLILNSEKLEKNFKLMKDSMDQYECFVLKYRDHKIIKDTDKSVKNSSQYFLNSKINSHGRNINLYASKTNQTFNKLLKRQSKKLSKNKLVINKIECLIKPNKI